MADLQAGATGSMTSAMIPDQIKPVIEHFLAGKPDQAASAYARVLPAINFENRQCGFRATKVVMEEGGVIQSSFLQASNTSLTSTNQGRLARVASASQHRCLELGQVISSDL